MMTRRYAMTMCPSLLKIPTLLAVTALVTACKLTVVSPPGGDVTSSALTCAGGAVCEVAITDVSYTDTFTATPKNGYEFVKWLKADGFFCGDTSAPCTVQMPADAKLAADVVALFTTGYIMPIYKEVGDTDDDGIRNELDPDDDNDGIVDSDDSCPLNPNTPCELITATDTVVANGKVWAQVDLFTNLSWNQINAVCPQGVCGGGTLLNGHDMTGWTWANADDIAALFNGYGVLPALTIPNFVGSRSALDSTWAPAFFGAGWRPLSMNSDSLPFPRLFAFTFYPGEVEDYFPPAFVLFDDVPSGSQDNLQIGWGLEDWGWRLGPQDVLTSWGAFFYR